MNEPIFLATYGTLRYGLHNWNLYLREACYLKTTKISGFELYHNGSFPYAVEQDFKGRSQDTYSLPQIVVDLFQIDALMLENCDRLEEYPQHYNRKKVRVGSEMAWIYFVTDTFFLKPQLQGPIPSGDWKDVCCVNGNQNAP